MKLSIVLVKCLLMFGLIAESQNKVRVLFIANDSLRIQNSFIVSRLIITGTKKVFFPEPLEVSSDSVISNFGFFETQILDLSKNIFVNAPIFVNEDKIIDYEGRKTVRSDYTLNVS